MREIKITGVLLTLLLVACGGGGGSSTGATSPVPGAISVACSGTNCGSSLQAATATTSAVMVYSGTGTGIWSYENTNNGDASVPINLSGVSGKNITYLWQNVEATPHPLSSTALSSGSALKSAAETAVVDALTQGREELRVFSKSARTTAVSAGAAAVSNAVQAAYTVGTSTHSWLNCQSMTNTSCATSPYATTLRSQATLSNGQNVNIWVQDSQWNAAGGSYKVTQAMADVLSSKFAASSTGIYDMVTNLTGGVPWGSAGTGLIASPQDIQIVVVNLTPDSTPYGLMGYFYGLNNYLNSTLSSYGYPKNSNEALMFFVDSETLSCQTTACLASGTAQASIVSTLAHEFVHMINFYQRGILRDANFDSWLEEISAMMAQDFVDLKLGTAHSLRDSDFKLWAKYGAYNCDVTTYNSNTSSSCFSYTTGSAFGGYLLRQYGPTFYQALLKRTESDSVTALDAAIKAQDSSASFKKALQRWGTAAALLDSSSTPSGFGYPARTDTVGGVSYTLPAVEGSNYKSYRSIPALPSTLNRYAQAVKAETSSTATYQSTVTVPPGTILTVVVN